MQNLRKLQLTLALIKPDAMAHPHIMETIKKGILDHGFYIVRYKEVKLTREKAGQFYKEHKGKFFFNRLISYMSSGPIGAHIIARHDGIALWRQMMGPTKVYRTIYNEPKSIRGQFGLSDTRNCTHGSDSDKSARKEIGFYFPEFEIDNWYEGDEAVFRSNQVTFDTDLCIHIMNRNLR